MKSYVYPDAYHAVPGNLEVYRDFIFEKNCINNYNIMKIVRTINGSDYVYPEAFPPLPGNLEVYSDFFFEK